MTQIAMPDGSGQFVTLGLDGETLAVPVETVLEILDMRRIARLPDAPAHVLGLIDVRGRNVSVMDLRARLGLPVAPTSEHSRILVLEVPLAERPPLVLGLVVDRVFEVTSLDGAGVEPPPDIGAQWRSDHIRGVGRRGKEFVIVLDVQRLCGDRAPVPVADPSAATPLDQLTA